MIAGVDGCRGGWYVAEADDECRVIRGNVYPSIQHVLSSIAPGAVVAIDIPIGLQRTGARACDEAARRMLGPKRGCFVFPAPIRSVLDAMSHSEASAMRREIEGKGMSIQAFAITAKVREVDAAMRATPRPGPRVFEVHPEVSFSSLNRGKPLSHSKKRAQGRRERLEILATQFGDAADRLVASRPKRIVGADDVLDALVALWSARRILAGVAESLPDAPGYDDTGLQMAIVY